MSSKKFVFCTTFEAKNVQNPNMDWAWAKTRLKAIGKTHDDLANKLGRSRTIITRLLASESPIKAAQIRPLAEVLEVPISEVLHRAGFVGRQAADIMASIEGSPQLDVVDEPLIYVPLISWVEAGMLREVADPYEAGSAEEYIAMNYRRESLIALRVHGESMNRLAQDGSIIIVDYEDRDLVSGKLYVFKTEDGEAAFKRYRSDPVRFEPVSTEEHETIFPKGDWFVVGRVVEVRNKT